MHWVERGPEPDRLGQIRDSYTPGWVDHYNNGVGDRPPRDSCWREFQNDLNQVFYGLCAYCEEVCEGQVDHFRPKSKFPELVYEWSNWLLSCQPCNHSKWAKWPEEGYVDPCSATQQDRPEQYFTFDTLTGEILPRANLDPVRQDRARLMIEHLRLNRPQHLKKRRRLLYGLLVIEQCPAIPAIVEYRANLASRSGELSSIARIWLSEHGYPVDA